MFRPSSVRCTEMPHIPESVLKELTSAGRDGCTLVVGAEDRVHRPEMGHPYIAERLVRWGQERAEAFIKANGMPSMKITQVMKDEWHFSSVCAYWRDDECNICLDYCARCTTESQVRNWNWPGCVTDRTPYGVVCHELGHHADVMASVQAGLSRGAYYGGYSSQVRSASKEKRITSYCPNDAEWFAEIFRLFVTNHALLYTIRPRTWELLMSKWVPVSDDDWVRATGRGIPQRILEHQEKR